MEPFGTPQDILAKIFNPEPLGAIFYQEVTTFATLNFTI